MSHPKVLAVIEHGDLDWEYGDKADLVFPDDARFVRVTAEDTTTVDGVTTQVLFTECTVVLAR